jgi:hypothetical protein
MNITNLTESLIRQNSTTRSFEKGKRVYQALAVKSLVKRGNLIQAEVGSSIIYQVEIELDRDGIVSVTSNYQGDRSLEAVPNQNWCRYSVAALLACFYQPELIIQKLPIESLLACLNRDQFQTLVQNLIKFDPNLLDEIEMAAQFLLEHSGITPEDFEQKTLKIGIESSVEKIVTNLNFDTKEDFTEELIEAINTSIIQPELEDTTSEQADTARKNLFL